jgi:hypothetical protein
MSAGLESTMYAETRTMVGYRVDPLVQGRIQLGYNVLFPLWPDESKEDLRLIDRILASKW